MTDNVREKAKRSLNYSYKDGTFSALMVGFTQDYFSPFLLLIGATTSQIGLLSALPNLASSLAQLKSADIAEKLKSRRSVVTMFVMLQALMLIPIAAMPVSSYKSPILFILLVTMFTTLGAFAGPPWASMMGDLVEENKRGSFFGRRNKILGIIIVAATFIAGLILQVMNPLSPHWGFALIFGAAAIFRMVSGYYLSRMYDPPVEYSGDNYFSIWGFLSRVGESNFVNFSVFVALMNFAVFLASPYFAVLMLQDLHFDYITYTVVNVASTLTVYLTMKRWGNIADRVGNIRILKLTSMIVVIVPLLWLINLDPIYLIAAQIVSGFAWAGFNLCASNFIYDSVTQKKRTRCIAYFNVFNGIAVCAGSIIGGLILPYLPPTFGYQILTLFVISSILRLLIATTLPKRLKEVRPVDKIKDHELIFTQWME